VKSRFEEAHEVRRLEVLDHLHRQHAAQRRIRVLCEPANRVCGNDVEAAGAADLDHRRIRIDATGDDAALAQRVQQLATAASDVDHVVGAREQRQILLHAYADVARVSAKPVLERDIRFGVDRMAADSGRARGRSADGICPSHIRSRSVRCPLQSEHALLDDSDSLSDFVPAGTAVFRVHVGGDGLQELHEP
jgi:hypothetical protein